MSTNASIAVKQEDGSYLQTYLHWDGYLSHAGKRLVENFNTPELAQELVELGDLSCIGTEIGVKHDFNTHGSEATRHMCCAYGRDRGEAGSAPTEFPDFVTMARDGNCQQYNYVFIDGEWYVCPSSFEKDALAKITTEVCV